MDTFFQIFRQEVSSWFKKPSTYLYFVVLFLLAVQDIYEPSGKGGPSGEIYRNAPIIIYSLLNRYSLWLTFLVIGISANAVNKDVELGVDKFYYALPLSKTSYLLGRFLGAFTVLVFLSSAIGLGALLTHLYLFHNQVLTGSLNILTYLKGYGLMVIPNLFVISAISFSLVTLVRSIIPAYGIAILSFMGFLVSSEFMDSQSIVPELIDPFGTIHFYQITQYWNINDKNTLAIPINHLMVINRIIWMFLGTAILGFTIWKFRFGYSNKGKSKDDKEAAPPEAVEHPVPTTEFTFKQHLVQTLSLGWFEFMSVIKSRYGLLLVLGVVFLMALTISFVPSDQIPTTFPLIDRTNQVFKFFMYILLTVISAEMVWKRKALRVSDLFDSLPIPNWTFMNAIIVAMFLICLALLCAFLLIGVSVQTFLGYYNYQMYVYLKQLFLVLLPDYLLFGFLSLFFHILVKNKFLSIFIAILYWSVMTLIRNAGLDFPLYHFKYFPAVPYSNLNGYGHFWEGYLWFFLFWALVAGILATIGSVLWSRGMGLPNLAAIKNNVRYSLGTLTFSTLLVGTFIYLNINVWEEFPSENKLNITRANYEKKYKKFENTPQPEITDIRIESDIFPSKQSIVVKGRYMLKNRTTRNIDTLHVTIDSNVDLEQVKINEQLTTPILVDKASRRHMYAFNPSLKPEDSASFQFKLRKSRNGFGLHYQDIVNNGTFIDRGDLMPSIISYSSQAELTDNELRKEFGLTPKNGIYPSINPESELEKVTDTNISFEAVLSTSKGQTAVTKGQLINSWNEGDRSYFHYKTDTPTSKEYSLFSGKYAVEKSHIQLDSAHQVLVEIFYHASHHSNIDMMLDVIKATLSYCHQNFGNYHSYNFKLIEVPGFRHGARSYPQTIAVYENSGFLDVPKEGTKSIPVFAIAHETAHQWFGSQVLVRQQVKGNRMVNETLAQYAALMVIKNKYGMDQVRQWLDYSMRRYLKGRVNDINEVPLKDVENQSYIYYDKGALAMYALQAYIGEANVNKAIAECIQKNDGYLTNTSHLLGYFKSHAPDSAQYRISDLFEKVIIYDNILKSATYRSIDDNKYELNLKIEVHKYSKDKSEIPCSEWITLEVETEVMTESKKVQVANGQNSFSLIVNSKPIKTVIDPNFDFLDKIPDDNMLTPIEVTEQHKK